MTFEVTKTPSVVTITYMIEDKIFAIFKLRSHEAAELYWKIGECLDGKTK